LIEGGNTGYSQGGASNQVLQLVQSSTLTNYLSTGATQTSSSGATYPHTTDTTQLISFVLNTVTATSAVIGLSVALTYASTGGVNNAWLRVTLLSTAPLSVTAPASSSTSNFVYEDRIQKLERMISRLNPTPMDSEDEFSLADADGTVGVSASAIPPRISSSFRKRVALAQDRIPPAK
jgi:hypothetical protein